MAANAERLQTTLGEGPCLDSTDPHGHAFQFLAEMGGAVVGPISVVLFDTPATSSEDSVPVPAWMATNPALRRHKRG